MSETGHFVDTVICGAGAFGLRAAELLLRRGQHVAIVDVETRPLSRASLINQARVHNGYHYPRSAYTALRSAGYYDRFLADFPRAINRRFRAVYAVAAEGSYIDAAHFEKFCATVGVPARRIDQTEFFISGAVEAAYETDEYTFDATELRAALLARIEAYAGGVEWFLADPVTGVERHPDQWRLRLRSGARLCTAGIVNATYASTNALLTLFGLDPVPLKYELCELVLVDAPAHDGVGITVMDGPFFSLMPFGHTGLHSLWAVDYSPRTVSMEVLPTFGCQDRNPTCRPTALANCGTCPVRPVSSYPYMRALAGRFVRDAGQLRKVESLHTVKVVLRAAEVDDGRPTLIRVENRRPSFITLFSGKVNTIYDLDDAL